LERRYRRLLAWYPKDHRAVHEEEMIAVLLSGVADGRRRPTIRDVLDLVGGGLAVRLHRGVGPRSRRHWRDALDIAALLGPMVLLALYGARVVVLVLRGSATAATAVETLAFALPCGLVAALAWSGRRKAAVVCAWGWALLYSWLVASPGFGTAPHHMGPDGGLATAWLAVSVGLPEYLMAACLTLAPSPSLARLGGRRLLAWFAAVAAILVTAFAASVWHVLPLLLLLLPVAVMAVASRFPVVWRAVLALLPLIGLELGLGRLVGGVPGIAALSAAVMGVMAWLARTRDAPATSTSG
jgi:hypothetical protein